MSKRKPEGISWESFVEQQIREAQEAGEFTDLPGMGKPLAELEEPYEENWWLKKKLRQEKVSLLPPALHIRRDKERVLAEIWRLTTERQVRRAVEELNERIRQANFAAISGPPMTTLPLDIDEVLAQWHARRGSVQ